MDENTTPPEEQAEAIEVHPITMFGQDDWAGLDLRPMPLNADTPEEESVPKGSSAAEPAGSSKSMTTEEDASGVEPTETNAPAAKDSGESKESSPGKQDSSPETQTSPGKSEQPAEKESTPKPSSPKNPTLPKPTKQSSPASAAK